MNKKTKLILNILAIVIVALIFVILIYSALTKPEYKYKLELSDITFYSDGNILDSFKEIKDSNSIIIVLDQSVNNYTLDNALIYLQIFSYLQKTNYFYILSKNNLCAYSNMKTREVTETSRDNCEQILTDSIYPKIYLGALNKEKTTIKIINNSFHIETTSLKNSFNENHKFLELIYPNLSEIENVIGNFTSDFVNKTSPQ